LVIEQTVATSLQRSRLPRVTFNAKSASIASADEHATVFLFPSLKFGFLSHTRQAQHIDALTGPEILQQSLTTIGKLQRENQHLREELRKAEIVIDVQKKVAALLGRPLGTTDREPQL
jgi:hypothetical protein